MFFLSESSLKWCITFDIATHFGGLFLNTVHMQTFIYTHIHSSLWTHARIPYHYGHLPETKPAHHFVIDKVTTDVFVVDRTSSPTERTSPQGPEECQENASANVKCGTWSLVGRGYYFLPNHLTTGWFTHFEGPWVVFPFLKKLLLVRLFFRGAIRTSGSTFQLRYQWPTSAELMDWVGLLHLTYVSKK